jgi:CHASE1-domain containing sensor protein
VSVTQQTTMIIVELGEHRRRRVYIKNIKPIRRSNYQAIDLHLAL